MRLGSLAEVGAGKISDGWGIISWPCRAKLRACDLKHEMWQDAMVSRAVVVCARDDSDVADDEVVI